MTKKELMSAVDTIKAANAVLWKAAQPLIQAYEKWGPFGSDEQAEHSYKDCRVDEDGMYLKWEDVWSYGGYDSGSLYIPMDEVVHPEKYEARLQAMRKAVDAKNRQAAEAAERAQFEILKAKYVI